MRPLLAASLCLALLVPGVARAQGEAAAPLEDKPAVQLNEVERGLFFGAQAGAVLLFGPGAQQGSGLSMGQSLGVTVGVDIGELLSVGLLVLGSHIDTPPGFTAESGMRGDFSTLTIGALARVNLFGSPDSNGIKRLFVDVHAGGGLGLMGPKNIYPSSDIVVLGGTGLQYFTHLRHFSIGLDADFLFGVSNMGPGAMLSPYLRYTF
ncbi:MAG TPA: hypothetical protein DFS52_09730 [Myxococcales bacterium]|jgi:hypothetical protein|nr:hypothetical protein [Myxococcales bacterium]